MRWGRVLHEAANGTSSVYKIVFTTMLLFELVRFGLRNRRISAENFRDRDHSSGDRAADSRHPMAAREKK